MHTNLILIGMAAITASTAYAGNVGIGVSAGTKDGQVKVQVGNPPPAPVVVERETVIVREKHDRGKHKGHYKKKKKKHRDHD